MAIGAGTYAVRGGERPDQRLHEGADDARGGDRGIEPRKGAAHDSLTQDALEAMGEMRAIIETNDLDSAIDRLGDQGVSEPAALQGAAGESANRGGELLGRRPVGVRYR